MSADDAQEDIDARFRAIVAQFDDDVAAAEQIAPAPAPPAEPLRLPHQWRMPAEHEAHILDEQSRFVPPEPRPLPTDDPHFWAVTICLVGGPLWAIYLFLFDRYARGIWWTLAAGMFFAGLVLLFLHQPASREDQDPDDDGAVL